MSLNRENRSRLDFSSSISRTAISSVLFVLLSLGSASCGFLFTKKDPFAEPISISSAFWGKWTRTDKEEYWYFGDKLVTISWPSINNESYRTTSVDSCGTASLTFTDSDIINGTSTSMKVTKESASVLKVEPGSGMPFRLLLYRGPDSSFSANFLQQISSSGSLLSSKALSLAGIGSIEVIVQNLLNSDLVYTLLPENGGITVPNAIIGDAYEVTVPSLPSVPPVVIVPQDDNINAGIVVLSGTKYSMKVEIVPRSGNKKFFYSGEIPAEENVFFQFRNGGKESFPNLHWTVTPGAGLSLVPGSGAALSSTINSIPAKSSGYSGMFTLFPTIPSPGASLYEDLRFDFDMEDGSGNKWADSVPLRVYREKFDIDVQSSLITKGYFSSVLLNPDNRADFDLATGFPVLDAPYNLVVTARSIVTQNTVYCVAVDRNMDPRLALADPWEGNSGLRTADTEMTAYIESIRSSTAANISKETAITVVRGGTALARINPGEVQYWKIDCTRSETGTTKSLKLIGTIGIAAPFGSANGNPDPGDAFGIGFTVRNSGDMNLDDIFVKLVVPTAYFEDFIDDGVNWNVWPKAARGRNTYRCDGSVGSPQLYKAGFSALIQPSSFTGESFIVGKYDYASLPANLVKPVPEITFGTAYMYATGGLSAKVRTDTPTGSYPLALEFYEGDPDSGGTLIQVNGGSSYEFYIAVN